MLARLCASVLGGAIDGVFLLFFVFAVAPNMTNEGDQLEFGLTALFALPIAAIVFAYVAWRGRSAAGALGRALVIGGGLGVLAAGILYLRYSGDRQTAVGLVEFAAPMLVVGVLLLRPVRVRERERPSSERRSDERVRESGG